VLDRRPCRVRLLRAEKTGMTFFDFSEYRRLVDAARGIDPQIAVMVLLGGGLHVLRHTFLLQPPRDAGGTGEGHPGARGPPDLSTTLGYMRLSPSAGTEAIQLLDRRPREGTMATSVATAAGASRNTVER
jgi:hypothetical protein